MLPGNRAGESTVDDLPLSFVDACDPANTVQSAYRPGKRTHRDGPLVLPCQAAQNVFAVSGRDAARDVEIPHRAGGLYVPKQSPHIAAAGDGQAGDGVSLSLKGAAEGRDGGKVHAGQINVRLQIDGFPLRPAVQGAVPGEPRQILCRAEINGIGGPSGQSSGSDKGEEQDRRQQETQEFTAFPFHLLLEPPWSGNFQSPASRRRLRRSRLGCGRPPHRTPGP